MSRVRCFISTAGIRPGKNLEKRIKMEESVIFNSPLLLICYGTALLLCVFEIKKRISGYVLPILSALVCLLTTAYALLKGATLYETSTIILIFLIVNLSVYSKNGRENK